MLKRKEMASSKYHLLSLETLTSLVQDYSVHAWKPNKVSTLQDMPT